MKTETGMVGTTGMVGSIANDAMTSAGPEVAMIATTEAAPPRAPRKPKPETFFKTVNVSDLEVGDWLFSTPIRVKRIVQIEDSIHVVHGPDADETVTRIGLPDARVLIERVMIP